MKVNCIFFDANSNLKASCFYSLYKSYRLCRDVATFQRSLCIGNAIGTGGLFVLSADFEQMSDGMRCSMQ